MAKTQKLKDAPEEPQVITEAPKMAKSQVPKKEAKLAIQLASEDQAPDVRKVKKAKH